MNSTTNSDTFVKVRDILAKILAERTEQGVDWDKLILDSPQQEWPGQPAAMTAASLMNEMEDHWVSFVYNPPSDDGNDYETLFWDSGPVRYPGGALYNRVDERAIFADPKRCTYQGAHGMCGQTEYAGERGYGYVHGIRTPQHHVHRFRHGKKTPLGDSTP